MTVEEMFFQGFGFLIQTVPIAFLGFVPFSREKFRITWKKICLLIPMGLILTGLGFVGLCAVCFDPSGAGDSFLRGISNAYMAAALLLWICSFWYLVQATAMQKILILLLLTHYAAVLFTATSIFVGVLPAEPPEEPFVPYGPETCWSSLFFLAVTLPFVYRFFRRTVKRSLPLMEEKTLKRGIFYAIFIFSIFAGSVLIMTNNIFLHGIRDHAMILFLLSLILTDAVAYYFFFSQVRLTGEKQVLEEQLRRFDEEYRKNSSNIELFRRMRHDIRHHLRVISVLNREGKQEEIESYLSGYTELYPQLEEPLLSGDSMLNDILHYYIERARRKGITVKPELSPSGRDLGLDAVDMTMLFGNIMENAIEACECVKEKEKRFIRIWGQVTGDSLLFLIENSCPQNEREIPEFTGSSSFSVKRTAQRGYGLQNIRLAAEKYGGSAEFKRKDGVFSTRVVLNYPGKEGS